MSNHLVVKTEEIIRIRYVSAELQREIMTWEELTISFSDTFIFANDDPFKNNALQHIHGIVLEVVQVEFPTGLQETPVTQLMME